MSFTGRCLALGVLAACAACSDPSPDRTVTVCTGNSCTERVASATNIDPASKKPDPDPDGRIAALERMAADNPGASYDLGLRFFRGDGVPQDSYKALQWMRRGAESGDTRAQLAVGRLYFTGLQEMGPDLQEAERWLGTAAAAGNQEAKALLVQVQEAKDSDATYRRKQAEWRAGTYYYWGQAWVYRWYWTNGAWAYRGY